MVIHRFIVRPGPFGGILTTTLCGRMNRACNDGINSGDGAQVTCKFCIKIAAARGEGSKQDGE